MRPVQSVVVSMPPAGASFLLPDQCPRGPVTPQKQLQRATAPGHRGTERRTSRIAAVRGQSIADRGQCAGHSRRHAGSAEDGRLSVPIGSAACAVPKTGKCGPKDCDASPRNSSPSQAVRLGHFDAAAVAWFNHRATVCRRLFGVGGGIGTRRCHDESHQGLPREAAE